ncbi:phosphonate C-P lyase system protein PhnG [Georgenia deserti]|uniref:Phosphonate C-P lyase system protein PhnG n=1 Tax=Georgenia deserti TaxID=2093781 RepID=A0ABW4L775_9MICO
MTRQTSRPAAAGLTREERTELLSRAGAADVVTLADRVLAGVGDDAVHLTRPPQVGIVVAQVREPLAGHRFLFIDVLTTQAELELDGHLGWAMRTGEDRRAALAQAVCDAEAARGGPHARAVEDLALATRDRLADRRAEEWERLVPTIVEFEEVP